MSDTASATGTRSLRPTGPVPVQWDGRRDALAAIVAGLSAQLGAEPVWLNRADGVAYTIEPLVLEDPRASSEDLAAFRRSRPMAGTLSERAFRARATVFEPAERALAADMPERWAEYMERFPARGFIASPILVDDAVVGTVVVGQRRDEPYDETDLLLIVECADRIARVLTGRELAGRDRPSAPGATTSAGPRRRLVRDVLVGVALPLIPTVLLAQRSDATQFRPATFMLVAVLAAVAIAGLRAGIIAGAVATVAVWWQFDDPRLSFATHDLHTVLTLLGFVFGVTLTLLIADRMAWSRRREAQARILSETLIDNAPLGVAMFDTDGRFVRVNQRMSEASDRTVEEHLGKRPRDLHALAGDMVEPLVAEVLRTGLPIENREFALELPDEGIDRHWRASFYPIHDDQHAVVAVGAFLEETTAAVTARRRNERLSQLARELAAAVSRDDAVAAVYAFLDDALHAHAAVAFVNDSRRAIVVHDRLHGYDADTVARWAGRVIGWDEPTPFAECASTVADIAITSMEEFEQRYPLATTAAMLATGDEAGLWVAVRHPTDPGVALAVLRMSWPYPREVSAESRRMLQTVVAVFGLALHRIDLAEAAANDMFRRALDSMIDTVAIGRAVRDDDGRIVDLVVEYMNPSGRDRSGHGADDIVGRLVCDLYPEWRGSGLLERYASVIETGTPFVAERIPYPHPRAENLSYWSMQVAKFGDDHYLAATRDVTEIVANETAARAAVEAALRERVAVELLQQSALPEALPPVPGVHFEARYRPAAPGEPLGGDWYDVFLLDDHTVALVIADVAGHGTEAAAAMVQVRNIMRAMAVEHHRPDVALERVNSVLRHTHLRGAFVTCCLATFDTCSDAFTFSVAGHPPPLFVDDGCHFGTVRVGPPLGVVDAPTYHAATVTLHPGTRVVLYTDGLVERRGEHLDVGMERLRQACTEFATAEPAAMVDRILTVMDARGDDIAVLSASIT